MKASQQINPQYYQQYKPSNNNVQSFGPVPFTRLKQNKSLLDKYSFEDNDMSRTSEIISQLSGIYPKSDDEDWLRLSIKEITTIGRELITFYLAVKYFVEYQEPNQPNFDKKITQTKLKQTFKEVKEVKSKLVHGSILQSQHKNLILNLKCKKPQVLTSSLSKPILTRIQFSIMRIFQTRNQPVLMAKQFIDNPSKNDEYEIDFMENEPQKGAKPKPVAAMIFQINNAIQQELDGSENKGSERDEDELVSEHLEEEQEKEKFQNYTLGKPQKVTSSNQVINKKSNIFDNDSQNNYDDSKSYSNPNSQRNNLNNYTPRSNNEQMIQKLSELSHMIDQNLQKSKNQDQAYKNYLQETSNMIQNFQSQQNGTMIYSKSQQNKNNIIKQSNDKGKKASNGQLKDEPTKNTSEKTRQVTQQSYTKQNDYQQGISNAGSRYDYVSRIQNTYIGGEKFNSDSRAYNSNQAGGERYDYVSRVQNTNFLEENNLNDLSLINPINPVIQGKKPNMSKKQPFFQFNANAKKQNNQAGSGNKSPKNITSAQDKQVNQSSSRWVPFNLSQLDSSNIRYEYNQNQNDASYIEETKNMQELINQIQKIQKQWFEKRVLNRQNRDQKQDNNKQNEQDPQKNKLVELVQYPDDLLDIQLKKFKIKFSEETFERKLIDGLKTKHLKHLKRNGTIQNAYPEIPKNYIVYLIANQIDDQNMNEQPQNSSKIEIKIPASQIAKLLQLEAIQKQHNPSNQYETQNLPTMSKTQQKQIIKAFEKQIYSKVMKIKINKGSNIEKKKARIIEIALQEEYQTLSELDLQGSNARDTQQNRISLVGMYPLPIFGENQKDGQTSFYQNVSVQPLAISMYDTKTGAQEGKLRFELKKGKIDKEIQTLQPLEDMDEPIETNQNKNSKVSLAELKKKKKLLEVEIGHLDAQQNLTNPKAGQKQANRQQKSQSKSSLPYSFQSQQLPINASLKFGQQHKKSSSNKNIQPQTRQSLHNFTPGEDNFGSLKKIKTSIKLNQNDRELSSLSKIRPKSINQFNEVNNASKDAEMIGKIFKNHSNHLMEGNHVGIQNDSLSNLKTLSRQNNKSEPKPQHFLQADNKKLERSTSIKALPQLSKGKPNQIFNNSPSSIHQNGHQNCEPQSQSSYRLMKKQFLATANMLQSIKLKAQQYIDKVQSERKIHTSDNGPSDKEGWEGFDSRQQSKAEYTLPIQKKAIHLQVNSFVINQTILSKKLKSRNSVHKNQLQMTPLSLPINPKAVNYFPSKKQSVSKSRNSKNSPSPNELRRNKFTQPVQKKQEQLRSRNKNYERQQSLNGSVISLTDKKSKTKQQNKKPLIYKEESQYHFTEEQGQSNGETRKRKNIGQKLSKKKSSKKVYGVDYLSDQSNKLEQSGIGQNRILAHQYPQKITHTKSSKKNIQQSSLSTYPSEQIIEIKLYSLKIKLLSLPLVTKLHKNSSQNIQNGKQYFVLVYTDFSKQSCNNDEMGNMIPPMAQKCFRRNYTKQDQLLVSFSGKHPYNSKEDFQDGNLMLKGLETSKLVVQLYQSSQLHGFPQKPTSLQHISLITLSPPHKRSQNRPFASLSVTFIQLLAQQESISGFNPNLQPENLTTYTNFLYSKQKIVGKININYITQVKNANDGQNHEQNQMPRQKAKNKKSRKEIVDEYKHVKNSFIKGYPDGHIQKDNEFRTFRSESSMTKKLSPKHKKEHQNKQQQYQQERNHFSGNNMTKNPDPLQILKRRLPKPIKSEDKRKSQSQSYAIRLNRPYHTPMNRGKGKDLFESLNSSASVNSRGERYRQRKHKDSAFSSSHFQGEPVLLQSPTRGNKAELMQLRQKKQEQKIKKLKAYQATSHVQQPYQQTEQTRISQKRHYDGGGNIKFGKSSRFSSEDSLEIISRKGSKQDFPGPGHYEAKSLFDRHTVKEP